MQTHYLLGLDGGGTKTDALLCTADGEVKARCTAGPSSLTGQSEESAFLQIRTVLTGVLSPVGGLDAPIAGFYAGISGGGLEENRQKFRALFRRLLSGLEHWDCGSDSVNALSAGIGCEDGIIAIAGTGSSVFGRKQGAMRQVGGWGYLLGDEGSGFDLGRRALTAALRALDGRGEPTLLQDLCETRAACALRALVARIYQRNSKAEIASFAPVLLRAARQNDAAALAELEASAGEMAHAIRCARRFCGSANVVLGGSVWQDPSYRAAVERLLGQEYTLITPRFPPVYGSVTLAAALAGFSCGEAFRQRIEETIGRVN